MRASRSSLSLFLREAAILTHARVTVPKMTFIAEGRSLRFRIMANNEGNFVRIYSYFFRRERPLFAMNPGGPVIYYAADSMSSAAAAERLHTLQCWHSAM
jgi:hypothetical protein